MDALKLIKSRRTIRRFKDKKVPASMIKKMLEAGRWAPSGLNNQPWKFVIIRKKEMIEKISACTKFSKTASGAPLHIAVFMDSSCVYNRTKDCHAIGACIQNILLMAHSMKLGACWLGEILNQRKKAEALLRVPKKFELMAVIAAGFPDEKKKSNRLPLKKLKLLGIESASSVSACLSDEAPTKVEVSS